MIKLFAVYGCYLERVGVLVHVTNRTEPLTQKEIDDLCNREIYSAAYELAEGWVGSHGFCEDDDGEALDDYHDELESQLEYTLEPYDPEEHDGWLCGEKHDILEVTV